MGRITGLFIVALVAAHLPSQRSLFTVYGSRPGDEFGVALRAAGDVDKDGIPDLIVASLRGRYVRVFSGSTGRVLYTFRSNSSTEWFGFAVSGAGDVDGDGHDDVLVSAPFRSANGVGGAVDVFSGRTGLRLFESASTDRSEKFGIDVSAFRDVDGDRKDDFLVAASRSGNDQRFYVVSGATGRILRTVRTRSLGVQNIRTAGDIDKDGIQDILVGSKDVVHVWSGRSFGRLLELRPFQSETVLAACGPGDVDGDGRADVVVLIRAGARRVSVARAYSGKTGRVLYDSVLRNDSSYSAPSWPLAPAGDVDRDGRGDYAVGTRGIPSFGVPAEFQVLSGSTGTSVLSIQVLAPRSSLGRTIDLLGDLDRDGFSEIAVADPGKMVVPGSLDQGEVRVISGRILGDVTVLGPGCGGGPFIPVLRSTRPVLGSTVRVVGERAPAARNSVLLVSGPVERPRNLGVPACNLYVDPATLAVLPLPKGSNWALSVPIPFVRTLTGRRFHLQALFDPTAGPLKFDLSNGLGWRLGY